MFNGFVVQYGSSTVALYAGPGALSRPRKCFKASAKKCQNAKIQVSGFNSLCLPIFEQAKGLKVTIVNVIKLCRQWLQTRRNVPQSPECFRKDLDKWSQSALGRSILASEQQHIDELLRYRFGYHLAQFSIFQSVNLTAESRINHRLSLQSLSSDAAGAGEGDKDGIEGGLAQQPSRLPFDGCHIPLAEDSVDVLMLHHSLEFSQSPHELLREAQRVLIPQGYLIITAFNPYSLMGLYGSVARFWHRSLVWRKRFIGAGASKDWLQLLGLQPIDLQPHFYRPPVAHQGVLQRLSFVEALGRKIGGLNWGASYTIVARKEVAGITPIKPKWQSTVGADKLAVAAVSRGARMSPPRLFVVPTTPPKHPDSVGKPEL